jgi:hypothetical protein
MDSALEPGAPPSTPPDLFDHGLQVHLHTRSITASKCISELHDRGLHMHLQIRSIAASKCISEFKLMSASKCISKLARSQPPSVSLNFHDYGLQTRKITASKCISKLVRSRPWSVSLSSLDRHFQEHLELLKHRLQTVQIYRG